MHQLHRVLASAILALAVLPACDDTTRPQGDALDGDPSGDTECASDETCTGASQSAVVAAATCSDMSVGPLANLNGFDPFPLSNAWNTDISGAQVDPSSANIIRYIGSKAHLQADFGAGLFNNQTIGIPYQIVAGTQPKVPVILGLYAPECDPGPMPIPPNALIEGYPNPDGGDRHVLVLDKDNCFLYELFNAFEGSGQWAADATAVWDMTINSARPYTWTSADAAGLPIFAGLVRYEEAASGVINHALRFTASKTRRAFTPPASHWASNITNQNAPPMGTRLRLKAGFDISGYPATVQVILTALKTYGMILADNGSSLFISGAPDERWSNTDLGTLRNIAASSFDVVKMSQVYTPNNVPTGPTPVISSFTASPTTVGANQPVTLSWAQSGAIYQIVSPQAGAVRGTSVVVNPASTTTYTLYATNQYGRVTKSVTVTVQ